VEVQRRDPVVAAAFAIDLEEIEAAGLTIGEINAVGGALRVKKGKFSGDIDIGKVDATGGNRSPNG
jgi:hypothetical protein